MMLFKEQGELEAIEINPVKEISNRKSLQRLRTLLTEAERKMINSPGFCQKRKTLCAGSSKIKYVEVIDIEELSFNARF